MVYSLTALNSIFKWGKQWKGAGKTIWLKADIRWRKADKFVITSADHTLQVLTAPVITLAGLAIHPAVPWRVTSASATLAFAYKVSKKSRVRRISLRRDFRETSMFITQISWSIQQMLFPPPLYRDKGQTQMLRYLGMGRTVAGTEVC